MKSLIVMLAAAVLGGVTAWGITLREFATPEYPLSALPQSPEESVQAGQPRIMVEESETFDFGSMDVNSTRSHIFKIKNIGGAPLTLTKGEASCKCTVFDFVDKPLPPGESCEVNLEWHPASANEEFEQSAEIHTTDPQRPHLRLIIRGRVLESLKLDPSIIAMGQISNSEEHSYTVRLLNFRNDSVAFGGWESSSQIHDDLLSVESLPLSADALSQVRDAKSGFELKITLKAGWPLGNLQESLQIKHNLEGLEPLTLDLSGRMVGDITILSPAYDATRDFLEMGNVSSQEGKKVKCFVVVKGKHKDTVKLQLSQIDPATSLTAILEEPQSTSGNSVLWPLTLEVPVNAPAVNRLGNEQEKLARVNLSTNHPDIPSYSLRVRMAVTNE